MTSVPSNPGCDPRESSPDACNPDLTRNPLPDSVIAAALVALLLLAAAWAASSWARTFEIRNAAAMIAEVSRQRDLGVALASAAFARANVLPVYGSSELEMVEPFRAADFFRDAHDGFMVCPEGRRGASPLILLERMAAVGRPPAGPRAVLILSPVWFLSNGETGALYAGNFSVLQELKVIFETPFSRQLRRDIARRMLEYPDTLARNAIMAAGVQAAAGSDAFGWRIIYNMLRPLAFLQIKIMELQDHFESVLEVLRAGAANRPQAALQSNDWNHLIAIAGAESRRSDNLELDQMGTDMRTVWMGIHEMPRSSEWRDVDLILRAAQELHIELLILNIPWSGPYYDQRGVSAGIRDYYYSRLRKVAASFHLPFVAFQDHEYDPYFLSDRHSHLSAKGWVYFDRDIDAFWHDMPLPDR